MCVLSLDYLDQNHSVSSCAEGSADANEGSPRCEVHTASILESRQALSQEQGRIRYRQRRAAMSDEALALFRESCRAQYRRKQEQHRAAAEAPATPTTDHALWPACLHASRSTGIASSQLDSTSYATASGSPTRGGHSVHRAWSGTTRLKPVLKQENAESISWVGQQEAHFTFDHVACETTSQEMLFRVAGPVY